MEWEGVKIKVGSLKYICTSVHGGFVMVLHRICSSVQMYLLFDIVYSFKSIMWCNVDEK